jgi:hypothetical protein
MGTKGIKGLRGPSPRETGSASAGEAPDWDERLRPPGSGAPADCSTGISILAEHADCA